MTARQGELKAGMVKSEAMASDLGQQSVLSILACQSKVIVVFF